MAKRMRLLDIYCGGFGAGVGYRRAGFAVTGIDIKKRRDQPTEPVTFIQADAREILSDFSFLRKFDAIHASPPCQTHTRAKHLRDAQGNTTSKLDLVDETRDALDRAGVPYVMENVPGAPLRADVLLCGAMFPELRVRDETGKRWLKRHRIFEVSGFHLTPPRKCCTCISGCSKRNCGHRKAGVRPLGVYASKSDNIPSGGQTARSLDEGRALMGINWMSWSALVEAIPPAYTEHLGRQMLEQLSETKRRRKRR